MKIINGDTDLQPMPARMAVVEPSRAGLASFGHNFGSEVILVPRAHLEAVLAGQMLAMDVNGGEYTVAIVAGDGV